jgi:CheY-like chemotaxis protein
MPKEKYIPTEALSNMKILVVEDNLLNQKIAAYLIRGYGFGCDVCANGKEAIQLLKKGKYDLVMMDIQMPEMDGYETTAHIRNDLQLNMPVIATTGTSSGSEKGKCIESGMTDYISKPLKSDELYKLLTTYLFPDKVVYTGK